MKEKEKNSECGMDDKFAEEVAKEVFKDVMEKTDQRRILARKADGEIVFEVSMKKGLIALVLLSIFLFPAVVIGAIASYVEKIHFSIIREISDDEAQHLEAQDTIIGEQPYEMGDGEHTQQLVKAKNRG